MAFPQRLAHVPRDPATADPALPYRRTLIELLYAVRAAPRLAAGARRTSAARHECGEAGPEPVSRELGHSFQLGSDGDDRDVLLGELLTRLHAPVERWALARLRGLPDAGDAAADVAQETLVRVARSVEECRAGNDAELMAWVLATARNALIDLWRSPASGLAARQLAVELEHAAADRGTWELPEREAGGSGDLSDHERLLRLAVAAYDGLPEATASLLWSRLVGGAEWGEVGARHATTAAGAKRRYQRAQASLRRAVVRLVAALPSAERAAIERLLDRYGQGGAEHAAPEPGAGVDDETEEPDAA